jgi:hypothetical protein
LLGFLSPDAARMLDSRETLTISKSVADSISIERTKRDKFRHALRSISKVAFSQLGLGIYKPKQKSTLQIHACTLSLTLISAISITMNDCTGEMLLQQTLLLYFSLLSFV